MPPVSDNAAVRLRQALADFNRARLDDAERGCRGILAELPRQTGALHLLGVIEARRGRSQAALELIGLVTRIEPDNPAAHSDLGNVLRSLRRHSDAITSFDRALALVSDYPDAHNNRGVALHEMGRHEEALLGFGRALALKPDYVQAFYNRGNALQALKRPLEALESYERALSLKPRYPEALNDRGNALRTLKRFGEALESYGRALTLDPRYVEAHNNLGNVLRDLGRHAEALESYDAALALWPQSADVRYNRGVALESLGRYGDAAQCYATLLEGTPDYPFAKGRLHYTRTLCCDWSQFAQSARSIEQDVRDGKRAAEPFIYQAISASPRDLRRCAEIYAAARFPFDTSRPTFWGSHSDLRIRVGYVSGEFREHATSSLMAGLFERHDRAGFRLYAFDTGWDDASAMRGRIDRAFDEVVDLSGVGDREAAAIVSSKQIDILVDLNGYFGRARPGIFCHRPCAIQVNYLGFPGTLGLACYDYIVADRHVIAPGEEAFYAEKIVYLPDSYQANDPSRRIADRTPARADVSLPDAAFVFCCFNNSYKITPEIFDIWMWLLAMVPHSVLWLLESHADAPRNLRHEAENRGVAPERLVFAPRLDPAEHLARHRLADLFLDTLPSNAHTTASDALWAGLPVLTCMGSAFAGRVAGSLLEAVGLPGLITHSLEDYERKALELAGNPEQLRGLRATLMRNRATHALFDTDRFRRHIESAYATMWERHRQGLAPLSFAVRPID